MTRACMLLLIATSACDVAPSVGEDVTPSPPADDRDPSDGHVRPEGTSRLPDDPADVGDHDTAIEEEEPVAPSCAILEPVDGAEVLAGAPIRFEGAVDDADDDVRTVTWRSDVWGAMVLGTSFDFELPAAEHVVTMTAVDAGGRSCTASVRIVVN